MKPIPNHRSDTQRGPPGARSGRLFPEYGEDGNPLTVQGQQLAEVRSRRAPVWACHGRIDGATGLRLPPRSRQNSCACSLDRSRVTTV